MHITSASGRQSILHIALCLWLLCATCTGMAGEILASRAEYRDGHYLLHLDMRLPAKPADVYALLVDFKRIPLINSSFKSVEVLKSKDKMHLVRTVAEGCIWFMCRSIAQLETVNELSDGYIMSETDPAHSDLTYGRALWHVTAEGKTTRVQYNADIVPAFWVPPLIGPALVKSALLRQGQKTLNGLERLLKKRKD
ncbi:MAG: hypothetical protein GC149_09295 [Gammaproteobacteria bacterium]|nr:hypothetical protein [Gammaproteobacteria bacterium]